MGIKNLMILLPRVVLPDLVVIGINSLGLFASPTPNLAGDKPETWLTIFCLLGPKGFSKSRATMQKYLLNLLPPELELKL